MIWRDSAGRRAITARWEEVQLYPETLNMPCFHAERCRVCQQKSRVLFYRDCPYSGRRIVTFNEPGIKQAQQEGCTKRPCLPSPASISPEGKVPNSPSLCFSALSFSQPSGSQANDCDLFGHDPELHFKVQACKKYYSRKTIFQRISFLFFF